MIRNLFVFVVYLLTHKASYYSAIEGSEILSHAVATPINTVLVGLEAYETTKDRKYLKSCRAAIMRIHDLISPQNSDPPCSLKQICLELETLVLGTIPLRITGLSLIENSKYSFPNKSIFLECLLCLIKNAHESCMENNLSAMVVLNLAYSENQVQLDILDAGIGMTVFQKLCAQIPGITTKREGKGIGMSYALNTLKKMFNASITIHSQKNIGTRITILLPASF